MQNNNFRVNFKNAGPKLFHGFNHSICLLFDSQVIQLNPLPELAILGDFPRWMGTNWS